MTKVLDIRQTRDMEMSEEDKKLQEDLLQLVDVLMSSDEEAKLRSLIHLRLLMQTSTTSMTSVPKPLKYLRHSYEALKSAYGKSGNQNTKTLFAEILSVLAMAGAPGVGECLEFCIESSMTNPSEWGHEYVRQLEAEIVERWTNAPIEEELFLEKQLIPLITSIVQFDMKNNAEIQGCDLCMEIDRLDLLGNYLDEANYERACLYLINCAAYTEDMERCRILEIVAQHYLKFNEYIKAMLVALQLADSNLIFKCLSTCPDAGTRKQLAFLLARLKGRLLTQEYRKDDAKDIEAILSNNHINTYFQIMARELDILEAKFPEDVYGNLSDTNRHTEHDSARANLAASFVSGFMHAAFGRDKLMANAEDRWVYRNKAHGMISATASLGLIHMWDVDGGLVPIDKYLYTSEEFVKSGALLAIGLVNCGVRNECDPALALLSDYVSSDSETLRIGATLGLGLAYVATGRSDLNELLITALNDKLNSMEGVSIAAIALGMVNVASADPDVSSAILQKLIELTPDDLAITHSRFLPLALGLVYMGSRDTIEASSVALEVLPEPYRLTAQTTLQVCAYAGTGDVLIVQELLRNCSESIDDVKSVPASPKQSYGHTCCGRDQAPVHKGSSTKSHESSKEERELGASQAMAAFGVSVVGLGEGKENSRIFGQIGRYGSTAARRAVPLAIALSSLSNPDPGLVDVLNKYSHDNDEEVSYNAIIAMGLVGAGTNNARLGTMLRQLAAYHSRSPSHFFLVRISQGLLHLGKGTLTLCPLRYASKVLDRGALAGILVFLVACLDCPNLILSKSHYLLYCLATAMEPRWVVTLDEDLKMLPVSVRIGQAVDVVGKVGNPKAISGGHVHVTPALLSAGEKAELMPDQFIPLNRILEGFVILREETVAS